jgi:hypothetical protein
VSAESGDIFQLPVTNRQTDEASPDGGDHLTKEQNSRWNLHVMAKFHVISVSNGLSSRDDGIGLSVIEDKESIARVRARTFSYLEDHDSQRLSSQSKPSNHLSEDIQRDLLICNSVDDTLMI